MAFKIAFLSIEILLRNLPYPSREGNFKGGLGILAGCIAAQAPSLFPEAEWYTFVPLYSRSWVEPDHIVSYEQYGTTHPDWEREITLGTPVNVTPYHISHGTATVVGFYSPAFRFLYDEDRAVRLRGQVVFAKAVAQWLQERGIAPDIFWLNEAHTAPLLWFTKEDPFFREKKVLFTSHTANSLGWERYSFYDFLILPARFRPYFQRNGMLDLFSGAMTLADRVNTVSAEHGEITKGLFPEFASKVSAVRNGTDLGYWTYPGFGPYLRVLGDERHMPLETLLRVREEARREGRERLKALYKIELDSQKPLAAFVRRLDRHKNQLPMLEEILPAICADRGAEVRTSLGTLKGLGYQMVGAGVASIADEECQKWVRRFEDFSCELAGHFFFVPSYNVDLLTWGAWAPDIWLDMPRKKEEACGTSRDRCAANGIPSITTATGGALGMIEPFDCQTGEGNGFLIEPYAPITIYHKLALFSDAWYRWREKKEGTYPALIQNVFQLRKKIDIRTVLREGYFPLFQSMLNA